MKSIELPDQTIQTQEEVNPAEELAQRFADELNRLLPEIVDRELAKAFAPPEHGQNHSEVID